LKLLDGSTIILDGEEPLTFFKIGGELLGRGHHHAQPDAGSDYEDEKSFNHISGSVLWIRKDYQPARTVTHILE
jgi:hypothetical protein